MHGCELFCPAQKPSKCITLGHTPTCRSLDRRIPLCATNICAQTVVAQVRGEGRHNFNAGASSPTNATTLEVWPLYSTEGYEKQTLNSISSRSLVTAPVMEQQTPFDSVMDVYLCTHFDPCSIRKATADLHSLQGATTELHNLRSFILASGHDNA